MSGSMPCSSPSSSSRSRSSWRRRRGSRRAAGCKCLVQARLGQGQGGGDQAHQAADLRRQAGAHRRHPAALGLHGRGQEGLRPQLADALSSATPISRRRNTRRSWSISSRPPARQWRKGGSRHDPSTSIRPSQPTRAAFGPQDLYPPLGLERAGAAAPARPSREAHRRLEVHRLQGLPGRPAWNGTTLREEVGVNTGRLRQPARPDAEHLHADALHRVGEPRDGQSRVADPQGRLHALRRSGLPQGLPGARRHRAVLQRHRRLRPGELHRLRLLREGMPVQHPAHLQGRSQAPTSARSAPTASPSARGRPAPRPARPRRSCSAPRRR